MCDGNTPRDNMMEIEIEEEEEEEEEEEVLFVCNGGGEGVC